MMVQYLYILSVAFCGAQYSFTRRDDEVVCSVPIYFIEGQLPTPIISSGLANVVVKLQFLAARNAPQSEDMYENKRATAHFVNHALRR